MGGKGSSHDIKGAPGEALCQLAEVFREVGHSHAALPVEGLHVVQQEQAAHTRPMPCNTHTHQMHTPWGLHGQGGRGERARDSNNILGMPCNTSAPVPSTF